MWHSSLSAQRFPGRLPQADKHFCYISCLLGQLTPSSPLSISGAWHCLHGLPATKWPKVALGYMVPALPTSEGHEDRSLRLSKEALLCCFLTRPGVALSSLGIWHKGAHTLGAVRSCCGCWKEMEFTGWVPHGWNSSHLCNRVPAPQRKACVALSACLHSHPHPAGRMAPSGGGRVQGSHDTSTGPRPAAGLLAEPRTEETLAF